MLPSYLYDVSLPLKHMLEYTAELEQRLKAEIGNVESVVFGHIADGNLHIFVRPSSEQAYAGLNEHEEVNKVVYGSLKNYGGSVSAEHGIGLEKMAWLNINRSHTELNLMRSIKSALDPKNLLNPGKVFSLADL